MRFAGTREPGLVALAVALALAPTGAAGASRATPAGAARGPFALVTLPALGTVTWSCEPRRQGTFALGYRASPRYATTYVRLRAGGRRLFGRNVQPGERVRLPFSSARVQALTFAQGTGAGTLRAAVTVDFVPNLPTTYCIDYAPPKTTVRITPRQ
jgi:hypothetical protein